MQSEIRDDLATALLKVLDSGQYINGPEVAAFETELAAYLGAKGAVAVSSGTDALIVAMMALNVKPGDEIITTPYTFFATAGSIARLGAVPVFVDIVPGTFNIDPEQIEAKISAKTVGIVPVHLFGQCADMSRVLKVAKAHNLWVLEDAAQAIGAKWQGEMSCTMGKAGCLSFFPAKNLGGLGDGGAVISNDWDFIEKVKVLREHGSKPRYYHHFIGGNFRLDALQAAPLRIKLKALDSWVAGRKRVAAHYNELLKGIAKAPVIATGAESVFNQYVIRVDKAARPAIMERLKAADIGHAIYYPVPLHLQPCFSNLGYKAGDLPQAELAADETLALPVDPKLSDEEIKEIVNIIKG